MPQDQGQQNITEDEAAAALQQLVGENREPEEPEPEAEASAEVSADASPPGDQPVTEPVEPTDDVESLRRRLEESDQKYKQHEERTGEQVRAMQERFQRNEKILRDRLLQKSTAVDRAREVLARARTEDGVTREDVDRIIQEIESTMNPRSASYSPPPQQQTQAPAEDADMVANTFLNEMGMTFAEETEFSNWIKTEAAGKMSPAEQAVAGQSLDGYLRLAHRRWREDKSDADKKARTDDAVAAIRSAKQTQQQAVRAGTDAPSSPKQRPRNRDAEVDVSKLKPSDISRLIRESVEQYR